MLKQSIASCMTMVIIASSQSLCAQVQYSRVRIDVSEPGMQALQQLDLDADHGEYDRYHETFTTTLEQNDIRKLTDAGFRYTIIVADEVAHFQANLARENEAIRTFGQSQKFNFENSCAPHLTAISRPVGFINGSYGGYYTFAQMQSRIDSLVNHYPQLVQKIILPQTTQGGRPLIVVKISDNAAVMENEPKALYTGLHHAREGMSMMNLFFFMQYLVENYDSDHQIKALIDNRELYFMPCVNPDGYVFNETNTPGGGGMWRKNRRNNGSSRYGVDLNRNYGVDWGVTGPNINISTNPSSDSYIGPAAFSEPETQAIRAFSQTRHFSIVIDHHAYGNYYVTPYGVPANHALTTSDTRFYKYASALMARYNNYFAGDGMETVAYYAVGNSRDYHMAGDIGVGSKSKTYGYTVEVGPASLGFWPSQSNILPLAKSMFYANMQMAYMAGSYYELQDRDRISIAGLNGNFHFSLLNIGLTNSPVSVRVIPLQNIQSVGPTYTRPGLTNYGDSANAGISFSLTPGLTPGSKIRYIYEVSAGGIVLNDTIEKIYQPVTLLYDGLEAGTSNWTFTGTWGTSTVSRYEGNRSLSESPSANYISNITSTATYNQPVDLSNATDAYVSFWVKHRAQNGYDKLQVQVSPTGIGAGSSFTSLCGQHTVAETSAPALTGIRENWTRETIDLGHYVGSSNIGLRFLFTSNSSGVDDGFYIDNIEIVKSPAIVLHQHAVPKTPQVFEITSSGSYSLYPNPVKNKLTLKYNGYTQPNIQIRFTTVSGTPVYLTSRTFRKNESITLDISHLNNQLYILTVTDATAGRQSVFKVVKQ